MFFCFCFFQVNVRFQAVIDCVEQARQDVLNDVKRKRDEKRKILDEQINIIQAEKAKVDTDIQVINIETSPILLQTQMLSLILLFS